MMRACSITAGRGSWRRSSFWWPRGSCAPYVRSAAFILDLSGTGGWARRLMPVRVRPVTTRDVQVPTRYGDEAARVYEPAGGSTRSLIVFPGVHAGGIDEPRLVAFSRRLASTGANVLSMPLPDLREFRITPQSTDVIEDATLWLAANRALAPERARRARRRVVRGRSGARRRRARIARGQGAAGRVARRARGSAARHDLSLHGRPARRYDPHAPRLRHRPDSDWRARAPRAGRSGRAAARRDPDVPRGVELRPDGCPEVEGAVRPGARSHGGAAGACAHATCSG